MIAQLPGPPLAHSVEIGTKGDSLILHTTHDLNIVFSDSDSIFFVNRCVHHRLYMLFTYDNNFKETNAIYHLWLDKTVFSHQKEAQGQSC